MQKFILAIHKQLQAYPETLCEVEPDEADFFKWHVSFHYTPDICGAPSAPPAPTVSPVTDGLTSTPSSPASNQNAQTGGGTGANGNGNATTPTSPTSHRSVGPVKPAAAKPLPFTRVDTLFVFDKENFKAKAPCIFIQSPRLDGPFIHHGMLCFQEVGTWDGSRRDKFPEFFTGFLLQIHAHFNPVNTTFTVEHGNFTDGEHAAGYAHIRRSHPDWKLTRVDAPLPDHVADTNQYFVHAQRKMQAGNLAEGLKLLNLAIEKDPQPKCYLLRATTLMDLRAYSAAMEDYHRAIAKDPEGVKARLAQLQTIIHTLRPRKLLVWTGTGDPPANDKVFASVKEALAEAHDGDEIVIDGGEHDCSGEVIAADISLSALAGCGSAPVLRAESSWVIQSFSRKAQLTGLRIEHTASDYYGGAIEVRMGSLHVEGCTVNSARGWGVVCDGWSAAVHMSHCSVGSAERGLVFMHNCTAVVRNCQLSAASGEGKFPIIAETGSCTRLLNNIIKQGYVGVAVIDADMDAEHNTVTEVHIGMRFTQSRGHARRNRITAEYAGFYIDSESSPLVEGNTISNCRNGVEVTTQANPVVRNNTITANKGVVIWAGGRAQVKDNTVTTLEQQKSRSCCVM